ncbi:MAG: saccharopine dehydrogenase NADP-binding domain-containing protein [Proteobacteria bacterium]|nr:saccharopine dehydrogenase NADP-binding domain-containing protein [Pseudomonadota bacterium]
MSTVLVLGAGKIGVAVAEFLAATDDYEVTLADGDATAVQTRPRSPMAHRVLDATDGRALRQALAGQDVVISALPFFLNPEVARAARDCGVHYFDLTEDVKTAKAARECAEGADTVFVSQCGLAPGFVSIVAYHLFKKFDEAIDVSLRVGALPQYPSNTLKYNLTWSTDGLINEYCNPCEAIHEGELRQLLALEGLEHFSLDGTDYEAFSTSGGVGSLCETLLGKVQNLNYKTIRYPGHRDLVWMLVRDLKLAEHRKTFKELIEYGIPVTRQDVVLIFVSVTGMRGDLFTQETFAKKIYGDREDAGWSAIQKTTAAAVCAMVDLHREGKLPRKGFVRQEEVDFDAFVANRFGRVYA